MRQIAQYQDGRLEIQEVPRPVPPPGGVVVRTTHSVISVGTEKMKVEQARMNLLQKARARPDQVRKVFDTARNLGWRSALEKVRNRLGTPTPLGYSAAGVVVEVEAGNTRFRVGDRVACAGAECAFHAEFLALPDLLVAPVPSEVPNWQAAYTTLCSIALQAVRQAEPSLGDKAVVLGQGLVGLLVTNMLRASGARVLAVDVQAARGPLCLAMGAERVVISGPQNLLEEARVWTEGYGADLAFLCTASSSNGPLEQAAHILRDRGRIVDVGNTKMDLDWKLFYEKELEIRFSRSYGPGRYDPAYEWGGSDYPIGYVRWTEQRNFLACLELMAKAQINLAALTTRQVPFAEALAVYQDLLKPDSNDVGVVLVYPEASPEPVPPRAAACASPVKPARALSSPVPRLDVIGAGNFARTMLLPHLQGQITLGIVVNQTALSASHVKDKFHFERAATDTAALWTEKGGAVLIATRHHLHAPLVKAALNAGRHVFVEKPLCLTRTELSEIDQALGQSQGSVQVGFNRRWAPSSQELLRQLEGVPGPKIVTYRVLAGSLEPEHWYANYAESGGRVLGEACHFLDYFCFLMGSSPVRVMAQAVGPVSGRRSFPDSVTAQVEFADGSCGQLIYTGEGDPGFPKETLSVVACGMVAELTNFQKLTLYRQRQRKTLSFTSKGHAEQMQAWLGFLNGQRPHPFPYDQARRSMLLTFAALESIQKGAAVEC